MLEKIVLYFENLARESEDILHTDQKQRFVGWSFADFFGRKKTDLDVQNFCIIFTFVSGDILLENSDQGNLQLSFIMNIFKSVGNDKKKSEVFKTQSQAFDIAMDIYRRIKHDVELKNGGDRERTPFDFSEIKNVGIDPLSDKVAVESVGVSLMITLKIQADLSYKAEKWQH